MPPWHGWMALKDRHNKVYEVFNHARLASYLTKPQFLINGLDPCSILDLGGCANYAQFPMCDGVPGWIDLPGTSGNSFNVPDATQLDITGDITIIATVAADDWSPAAVQAIVAKNSNADPNRSYVLQLTAAGNLQLAWSPDGTAASQITVTSSANLASLANGAAKSVAATLDVNDGAGNRVVRFWTSDDRNTWTQLGTTTTTAGTTSIGVSTAPLYIGALSNGTTTPFAGNIHFVSVRDGIGPSGTVGGVEVFKFHPNESLAGVAASATSFNSSDTGNRTIIFPGSAGNYLSTPDTNALDITGDLTIVARIAPDDWSPAAINCITSKWQPTTQYLLYLQTTGTLQFFWNPSSGSLSATSTANLSALANGAVKWVAVTFDVDNGAAGRSVRFWTSDDGFTWTQLGTTVTTAGVTSIQTGTSPLEIGGVSAGTSNTFDGRIDYLSVRSGIGQNGEVGGVEVFRFQAGVDLNNVAVAATSFVAGTGQTVTVNRSGSPQTELVTGRQTATVNRSGGSQTAIIPAVAEGGWVGRTYTSPATDPAPWYNSAYPESATALGFMLEEWTGLDDQHIIRSSTTWGGGGGGSNLGPVSAGGRTMAINMMLFGTTEESVDYLFRWLGSVFNNVCSACDTDKMLIRRYCGSTSNPEAGVAELRNVGITRGLGWESDIASWGNCQIRRASILLEAGDPCMYLPEAFPSVTPWEIGNLNACFSDVDMTLSQARAICRPACSELESTCSSTYSWTSSPMAAVAPIIVFDNAVSQAAFPFRATVYADPNGVGAANHCGLEILGQIYVRSLPPWSTMIWDVAGREVRYADHTTGGPVPSSVYLQTNDPPNRRFFAQRCAQAHLVIEPATLCIKSLGSNMYETGGVTFTNPAFPSVTITTQERVSCP